MRDQLIGHILLDAGDWENDCGTPHNGIQELRQKAADFIMTLPRDIADR